MSGGCCRYHVQLLHCGTDLCAYPSSRPSHRSLKTEGPGLQTGSTLLE